MDRFRSDTPTAFAAETNNNMDTMRRKVSASDLFISPEGNNDTDDILMLNDDQFASTLYTLFTEDSTDLTAEAYLSFFDEEPEPHSVVDKSSPALALPDKQEDCVASTKTYAKRCAEKWEERFHELEVRVSNGCCRATLVFFLQEGIVLCFSRDDGPCHSLTL